MPPPAVSRFGIGTCPQTITPRIAARMMPLFCFMTGAIGFSVKVGNSRNSHRAETASGKDIHLIFWPGLIVFNPKMTIFIQFNREIKK